MPHRPVRHALFTAVLTLGCNGALVPSGADAGPDMGGDAGVDRGSPDVALDGGQDAGACGCTISSDGWTLTMSWNCFCAAYGCAGSEPACTADRLFYPSCALEVDTTTTFGGPGLRVWDYTGTLVGVQYSSDTSDYFCPSDRSLHAARVRAGQFPDSSCPAVSCTCADGGTVCASIADGGTGDAQADSGGDARSDANWCPSDPLPCASGAVGGLCSDSDFQQPTCVNGSWKCPPGKIPSTQCGCFPGGSVDGGCR